MMKFNFKRSSVYSILILIGVFMAMLYGNFPAQAQAQTVQKTIKFQIGQQFYLVNGQVYDIDTTPYIKNGRTMVPLRFLGNALGISNNNISWDNDKNIATLIKDGKTLKFAVGSGSYTVNGQAKTMDNGATVPEIDSHDRVELPARYIAEEFGYKVDWVEDTETILITSGNEGSVNTETETYDPKTGNSQDIISILNKIIGGEIKTSIYGGTPTIYLLDGFEYCDYGDGVFIVNYQVSPSNVTSKNREVIKAISKFYFPGNVDSIASTLENDYIFASQNYMAGTLNSVDDPRRTNEWNALVVNGDAEMKFVNTGQTFELMVLIQVSNFKQ
ncbi:MAG: copper amine oxidase N-terminal domain-containing protein [Syntrophomonadaceae bacterium]|nr:copper amine oxidase N-terminal domain-containing protein [Syntrophomonadaceae bacterium]